MAGFVWPTKEKKFSSTIWIEYLTKLGVVLRSLKNQLHFKLNCDLVSLICRAALFSLQFSRCLVYSRFDSILLWKRLQKTYIASTSVHLVEFSADKIEITFCIIMVTWELRNVAFRTVLGTWDWVTVETKLSCVRWNLNSKKFTEIISFETFSTDWTEPAEKLMSI